MTDTESVSCTCIAPVNIAVIKYWGKRDVALNLPSNGSLSGTLDVADLHSRTTVIATNEVEGVHMWINGEKVDAFGKRRNDLLTYFLENTQRRTKGLLIASGNTFPTAAGLASSAAGYACLTYTLAQALNVHADDPARLSALARQGSGSACRSLFGGFVGWARGMLEDGGDSNAYLVVDETNPFARDMEILVLVADGTQKEVPSTKGMQETTLTSDLFEFRADAIVPRRMVEMEEAIREGDFESFARLAMRDSNQFHALCLDTFPPIFYLNDVSRRVIALVHAINKAYGKAMLCYTFDAGPNAVLYVPRDNIDMVLRAVKHYFAYEGTDLASFYSNADAFAALGAPDEKLVAACNLDPKDGVNALKRIIHTRIGGGPRVVDNAVIEVRNGTVVNAETGEPMSMEIGTCEH